MELLPLLMFQSPRSGKFESNIIEMLKLDRELDNVSIP